MTSPKHDEDGDDGLLWWHETSSRVKAVFGSKYVHSTNAGFVSADYFTMEAVTRVIQSPALRWPYFSVIKEGLRFPIRELLTTRRLGDKVQRGVAHNATLVGAIDQGYTLRLNQCEDWNAEIRQLLAAITADWPEMQATSYLFLTPAGNRGLQAHRDGTHIIVMQLAGSKTWEIYDDDLDDGSPGAIEPSRSSCELLLRPGDLLYLPHGQPHSAKGEEEASLHLTINMSLPRPEDYLNALLPNVDHVLARTPGSRASSWTDGEWIDAARTWRVRQQSAPGSSYSNLAFTQPAPISESNQPVTNKPDDVVFARDIIAALSTSMACYPGVRVWKHGLELAADEFTGVRIVQDVDLEGCLNESQLLSLAAGGVVLLILGAREVIPTIVVDESIADLLVMSPQQNFVPRDAGIDGELFVLRGSGTARAPSGATQPLGVRDVFVAEAGEISAGGEGLVLGGRLASRSRASVRADMAELREDAAYTSLSKRFHSSPPTDTVAGMRSLLNKKAEHE